MKIVEDEEGLLFLYPDVGDKVWVRHDGGGETWGKILRETKSHKGDYVVSIKGKEKFIPKDRLRRFVGYRGKN